MRRSMKRWSEKDYMAKTPSEWITLTPGDLKVIMRVKATLAKIETAPPEKALALIMEAEDALHALGRSVMWRVF
jgi:sulfur relay (sulfurtransferase) DsrC/TusE family protein